MSSGGIPQKLRLRDFSAPSLAPVYTVGAVQVSVGQNDTKQCDLDNMRLPCLVLWLNHFKVAQYTKINTLRCVTANPERHISRFVKEAAPADAFQDNTTMTLTAQIAFLSEHTKSSIM